MTKKCKTVDIVYSWREKILYKDIIQLNSKTGIQMPMVKSINVDGGIVQLTSEQLYSG
jgi:hypothetical protein